MATFCLSIFDHTFCGIFESTFRHFNITFASTRIAGSAYQKLPTKSIPFEYLVQLSNKMLLTALKFVNKLTKLLHQIF